MSFQSSTIASTSHVVPHVENHKVSGIVEMADGREVRVDVMQTYGSDGAVKASLRDVHHMKVYPYEVPERHDSVGLFSTVAGRVGGLAVCSVVVALVSWQIGLWFAVLVR